jgi:blocked early in transport 1
MMSSKNITIDNNNDSLEKENDRSLEHMSDRVSMLKNITIDIKREADDHNKLLDSMRTDMEGFNGLLKETVVKFTKVLETKNGRYACYMLVFFMFCWFLSKLIFS